MFVSQQWEPGRDDPTRPAAEEDTTTEWNYDITIKSELYPLHVQNKTSPSFKKRLIYSNISHLLSFFGGKKKKQCSVF